MLDGALILNVRCGDFSLFRRIARVGDRMHRTAALAIPRKMAVLPDSFRTEMES